VIIRSTRTLPASGSELGSSLASGT
jgi:hypothetical protein